MNPKFFVSLVAFLMIGTQISLAQDDAEMSAKLQFSSLFLGTNNNFETLKGEKYNEDDNWVYYESEYGLGQKAATILNSKKNTSEWYCYIQFSLENDLTELPAIQSGVFGMLNMVAKGGKIKGEEGSEGETTRTDLFVTKDNVWLGEIVTDNSKKTFHIFLKNSPWQ